MSLRGHQMRKLKRLLLAMPIVFGAAFVSYLIWLMERIARLQRCGRAGIFSHTS